MNKKCLYRLNNGQWVHRSSANGKTILRHFNNDPDELFDDLVDKVRLAERLEDPTEVSLPRARDLIAATGNHLDPTKLRIDKHPAAWGQVLELLAKIECPPKSNAPERGPTRGKEQSNNAQQKQKAKQVFKNWSESFRSLRTQVGNVNGVVNVWNKRLPQDCLDRRWDGLWGFRTNSLEGAENAGEKEIERRLLGKAGTLKQLCLVRSESDDPAEPEQPLLTAYHRFPLSNKKQGQVISDVLGVVLAGGRMRPILIEVKVKANDPWYALVECLQQVKLSRLSGERICQHLKRRIDSVQKGAWGIVVARDRTYFTKDPAVLEDCKKLLLALKEGTNARICFAVLDELDDSKLVCIAGNWD
jgi:hypothetical protein